MATWLRPASRTWRLQCDWRLCGRYLIGRAPTFQGKKMVLPGENEVELQMRAKGLGWQGWSTDTTYMDTCPVHTRRMEKRLAGLDK